MRRTLAGVVSVLLFAVADPLGLMPGASAAPEADPDPDPVSNAGPEPSGFVPRRAPRQEPAPASAPRPTAGAPAALGTGALEPLFARAAASPDGVVPLVLEASRSISAVDAEAGHALAGRLEPFARRAFFGPERLPGMERLGVVLHEVAPGELPSRIARRHGVGSGLLPLLNEGYDERRLQAGQRLKVVDLSAAGSLRVIVDRSRHRVSVWRALPAEAGWALMAYVPVGLGAPETPTPTGSTTITSRVLDPEWTDPVSGVVYAPHDPGNLLGGYWIALDPAGLGGRKGIGFHGYTGDRPGAWLERDRSNGCVRMLQPDVDRLFHLALEGTRVEIVP